MSAPLPSFDNTLGSLYLASSVTMALWGAGSVQTYYYFDTYRTDTWWLKLYVAIVWTLDTAHQALTLVAGYAYLVTNFGNVEYIGFVNQAILISLVLTSLVCALVQSFFVFRIFKLSERNLILTGSTAVLVLGLFILTIYDYGRIAHFSTFLQLSTDFGIVRAVNALGVVADAAIALSLVFLLSKIRSGYKRTDSLINRLIAYSVNTSLITSVSSVGSLIATIAWPHTFIFLFFYFSFTRMYTNALLASLNSRDVPGSTSNVHVHSSESSGLELGHPKRSARRHQYGERGSESSVRHGRVHELEVPRFATQSSALRDTITERESMENYSDKRGELTSLKISDSEFS